jgi:hypothetical protein
MQQILQLIAMGLCGWPTMMVSPAPKQPARYRG